MLATYAPSNKCSPSLLLWLPVALIVVFITAFFYHLGLYFVSRVQISVGFAVVMAIAQGVLNYYIILWGKVRSIAIALTVTVVTVGAGTAAKFCFQYQHARADLVASLSEPSPFYPAGTKQATLSDVELASRRKALLEKYTFTRHLSERVDDGWMISKDGNEKNAIRCNGTLVWIVWTGEVIVMLAVAGTIAFSSVVKPFSESLGEWACQEEHIFSLPNSLGLTKRIRFASSVDELLQGLEPVSDLKAQQVRFLVNQVPNDESHDAFLSAELPFPYQQVPLPYELATKLPRFFRPAIVRNVLITPQHRAQLRRIAQAIEDVRARNEEIALTRA